MSVSGSDPGREEADRQFVEADDRPFVETNERPTKMAYDHGGVPMYVAVIWVVFLASYVAYMVAYGLPDLAAWGAP